MATGTIQVPNMTITQLAPSGQGSVTVANNTVTEISKLTVEENGLYIVIRGADWGSSASGYRVVSNHATSSTFGRDLGVTQRAVENSETYMQYINFEFHSAQDVIHSYGYQNSGSSLACYPYMKAIKIS